MSDSKKSPEKLIDEVISFIERERELFGEFSYNQASNNNSSENTAKLATEKQRSDKSESSQKHSSSMAQSSDAQSPTAEENLFNQGETPDIYKQIGDCDTLKELEALCENAEVLHTDLEGTQLVFGVGNPDADLMLIGEAPGEEEDKQGEPFVGRAGKLLNKILAAIDMDREDVYIANILKHRPPNNRNPKPEERERSLPFLLRQIDLVHPKLILALGKVAAQTLLDSNDSLTGMRGEFHDFRGKYELLATYHPAALLRNPNWKRPTWEDMKMLRKRYDELDCSP